MPLQFRCTGCGRELLLEEAFRGGYCRCHHCRHLLLVPSPAQVALTRSALRPDQPPFAGTRPTRVRTTLPTIAAPARSTPPRRSAFFARLRSPASVVVLASVATICLSVLSWRAAMPPEPTAFHSRFASGQSGSTAGDEEQPRTFASLLASADPLRTYFTRPILGETVLVVVDGDMSMVECIAPVAQVTNEVVGTNASGERRLGVIMVSAVDEPQLVWVDSLDSGLAGARSVVGTALSLGRSDLAKAVGRTINLEASQVIVVFAKRIEADEIDLLAEAAQQTGAVVDLVILGEARQQERDLQRIAEPTGGRIVALTDADLAKWAHRVEQAVQPDDPAGTR